jgi:hypothetical protein
MAHIVITSINSPTKAVRDYAELSDHRLIVVGDRKTPGDWKLDGAEFISIDDQQGSNFSLAQSLPENHYSRKMLGYLQAMRAGAKVIVDTDDDNIPKKNYDIPIFLAEYEKTERDLGFVNVYHLFSEQPVWPRGLPLDQIRRNDSDLLLKYGQSSVGVFQGLADGDPDVDAIYRLTSDLPCNFSNREAVVLSEGTLSPFNSQNTVFTRELFPLLYLPTSVTFRYTDILRSFVAQPIMWSLGYELAFFGASVIQERNPHDYFMDFQSEIPMYQTTRQAIDVVLNSIKDGADIYQSLIAAYAALEAVGIVKKEELISLDSWISDCKEALSEARKA